jgi:hypothetical protein
MFFYTTQGKYIENNIENNIENFGNIDNSTKSYDESIKYVSIGFDTKITDQKKFLGKSEKDWENEIDMCNKKITEINKQFSMEKNDLESKFNELKKTSENNISQLTTDKNDLNKKIEGQKSCDILIKQSYADFDKQYQLQKNTYDEKIKEQKEITDKTMSQFLTEKENWTKQFDLQKIQSNKILQEEKVKLENIKNLFEEKIKKLESAIYEITMDIKKI